MATWFERGGGSTAEPARVDDYLLLPGCDTVGVKLRDGRFEVKARTASPKSMRFRHGVSGYCDAWVKWSSNPADPDQLARQFVHEPGAWLCVEKRRRLRRISLAGDTPREIAADANPAMRSCQVELTAIRAWPRGAGSEPAARWWSLSFEAGGEPGALQADLERALAFFFDTPPPVSLDLSASMSYPAWLCADPLHRS